MSSLSRSLTLQGVRAWFGVDAPIAQAPEIEELSSLWHAPPHADSRQPSREPRADKVLWSLSKRLGVRPAPFWPEGRPYALALTHDIDRVLATLQRAKNERSLRRLFEDLSTARRARRSENAFFNFDRMKKIENEWGVKSASYVLFERRRWAKALALREPQHAIGVYQPRAIADELLRYEAAGNEVGLHASFSSWNSADALTAERRELQGFGIKEVSGGRTHYLNWDERATPAAWQAAGLAYDSSIGFNFACGFRSGTSFPYPIPCGVLELPLHLMDTTLRFVEPDLVARRNLAHDVLGQVRESGGALMCNWHLHVMNRDAFGEEIDLLGSLIERAREDGAWLALPREIAAHWSKRL